MALEFDYPSQKALDSTLVSPERAKAKAETEQLMTMFDGRIFHIVLERRTETGPAVA